MNTAVVAAVAGIALIVGYILGKYWNTTDLNRVNEHLTELQTRFEALEKQREERQQQWESFLQAQQERTEDITERVSQFQELLFGTKQRGNAGEAVLEHYLEEPIKSGLIATDVDTGNGTVEYAVVLDENTYLPIDSKLPGVNDLIDEYDDADTERREELQQRVEEKMHRAIRSVTKYVNAQYTINKAVLSTPQTVIDVAPQLVDKARQQNVYLTSYKNTFLIAYLLYEAYQRRQEQGELGEYKQYVEELHDVLDEIKDKTATIDRGLTQVQNANDAIKSSLRNN